MDNQRGIYILYSNYDRVFNCLNEYMKSRASEYGTVSAECRMCGKRFGYSFFAGIGMIERDICNECLVLNEQQYPTDDINEPEGINLVHEMAGGLTEPAF